MTSKQRRRNLSNYVCDFTDKSPGQINQKEQLISKHPGPKKPWSCYRCKEQFATKKLFEDHSRKVHSIERFLYFCKCKYNSDLAKSTGSHMQYCNGTPPIEHQLKFKYEHCRFSCDSKTGLQVHMSISHKDVYNEQLQEKEKNFKWTVPEFEYLGKVISELKRDKIKNVNKVADEMLGSSEKGIQKIRPKSEYKQDDWRVKELMVVKEAEDSTLLDVDKSDERDAEKAGLAENRHQPDKEGN